MFEQHVTVMISYNSSTLLDGLLASYYRSSQLIPFCDSLCAFPNPQVLSTPLPEPSFPLLAPEADGPLHPPVTPLSGGRDRKRRRSSSGSLSSRLLALGRQFSERIRLKLFGSPKSRYEEEQYHLPGVYFISGPESQQAESYRTTVSQRDSLRQVGAFHRFMYVGSLSAVLRLVVKNNAV